MGVDPRFLADSGREVFVGNELLVKGALETEGGVHLLTGYPGSPVAGFFDVLGDIRDILIAKGIRAFQANNEALSVAAVNGSQMLPARAIAAFKSVGTHVASDALALGNLAGPHPEGGAVIISGDDPWCDSTQVPADCRFLFEHLRMPVVEPGTPQEVKDWIDLSFKLSNRSGTYIGYVVTPAQADGGGTVECKPNQFPAVNMNSRIELDTASIAVDKTVLLPPRTWIRELDMPQRHEKAMKVARELGLNRIEPALVSSGPGVAPLGFIVTGMAGPYLRHVLNDIGLAGHFPILHMGMSYPADVELLRDFARHCRTMIVIEERRSFLEKNLRDAAFRVLPHDVAADIVSRLYGKQFPTVNGRTLPGIPDVRGLNYSVLAQLLIPLIKATEQLPAELRNGRLSAELDRLRQASKPKLEVFAEKVIARTPTFCPGCPHRDSSAVLLELRKNLADPAYMARRHGGRKPVDLVAHGDTGCYTMLMFAPTESLMHNYSGMGLGGGTGSGADPFITNKQIVFMGDGTFFHSGQVAISNAIKAGQDITFIILENGTTAMTGHQEHPGTELDVLGNRSYIQDIETICRSMAGTSPLTVEKVNPADRDKWYATLERTILRDGVKVLIADKECGITLHRRIAREERQIAKKHGYLPVKTHMNVTPEVCENCLECTKQTACPGLISVDTDYGRKIDTDLTWCVNDGACERVRVSNAYGTSVKPCPSFEQVIIKRSRRKRYTLPRLGLDRLPDPVPVRPLKQPGDAWRCHLAGVGGMGIGVVSALLVRAGHREGLRVTFQDKKGLAIRNGGVYSQITFVKDSPSRTHAEHAPTPFSSGSIPYGRADLLLGVDILEAARAIDPREQFRVASKDRTAAVLNLHKQPTVSVLLGQKDFDPETLREEIARHCDEQHFFARNLSEICESRLGSKQFVNIMMLGVAFQMGLVPVSASSMAKAIRETLRRDTRRNLKAFNIGRKLALEPRVLPNRPEPRNWQQLVASKVRVLKRTHSESAAKAFETFVEQRIARLPELPESSKYDHALRLYDLLHWGGVGKAGYAYAGRYADAVEKVYAHDSAARGFAATHAAIWGVAKAMLIKDEPYVAYLLTRYEKRQRDHAKYGIDETNGDRIIYRHHTSPEFPLPGGRRLRLKITTTDWQLQLVSRFRFLRKLPGWHRREVQFREWYLGLIDKLRFDNSAEYNRSVRVLRAIEAVTGYREVRYPKMDACVEQVNRELAQPVEVPADDRDFTPDAAPRSARSRV
ncbi:MAG: 2-oxoacid:acceptor oxidoreductase family protein [Tepidisphaerales bacterium]